MCTSCTIHWHVATINYPLRRNTTATAAGVVWRGPTRFITLSSLSKFHVHRRRSLPISISREFDAPSTASEHAITTATFPPSCDAVAIKKNIGGTLTQPSSRKWGGGGQTRASAEASGEEKFVPPSMVIFKNWISSQIDPLHGSSCDIECREIE